MSGGPISPELSVSTKLDFVPRDGPKKSDTFRLGDFLARLAQSHLLDLSVEVQPPSF